jgi:serine/threonine protein phosphatase PrpC
MAGKPLILRYAARSHVGLVRAKNDDSAYVGRYLAVVADGMGGHAGGDVASASTVLDLIHLDHGNYGDDAGTHLADEIQTANSLLSELVHVNPKLAGMGTTVTALLLAGDRLAYAHIGDSRAYRLKDGAFEQMSSDHTFVQRMIDEGRMTEAEAEVHPHKNVLMRVLGDVDASPELDLKYFDAEPGERWLLCSDGLNFVRHEVIEQVIRSTKNLASAAETLIDLTLAAGSPDNVTVVVFDVAETTPDDTTTAALETVAALPVGPLSVGGGEEGEPDGEAGRSEGEAGSEEDDGDAPAGALKDGGELDAHISEAAVLHDLSLRPHELVGAALTANADGKIPKLARIPATQRAATVLTHKPGDTLGTAADENEESLPRARYRTLVLAVVGSLAVIALVAGAWVAYSWTQTQYFVGVSHDKVAIYQGVSQNLGPIPLSHLQRETTVAVSSLPEYSQQLVARTMPAPSLDAAEQIISDLQLGTGSSTPPCNLAPSTASPRASGGQTPFSTVKPTAKPTAKPTPSASTKPPASGTTPAAGAATHAATPTPTPTATCTPGGGH